MTIRTKLRLSIAMEIAFVVFITYMFIASFNVIGQATTKTARAATLTQTLSELRFVTFEYTLHYDSTSLQQWQLKHEEASKMLKSLTSLTAAEQSLVNDIASQQTTTLATFNQLAASHAMQSSGSDTTLRTIAEGELATQILIGQQTQITDITRLSNIAQNTIVRQLQTIAWLLAIVVFAMLVITIVNLLLIASLIVRSLHALQKGTLAIAEGNLAYRVLLRRRDEFGRLADGFNRMADSLEQVDKFQTRFMTIAAHQLRTPSSVINWSIEELLDDTIGKKTKAQADDLEAIRQANSHIGSRIDDILTATAIGTKGIKLTKKPSDPLAILDTALSIYEDGFTAKQITLTVTKPSTLPPISLDPVRMQVAFVKLIENAQMYTPAGGTVHITLAWRAKKLRFTITDNGIGVPKADQPEIFQRFMRASNGFIAMPDASGLGLFIAKHVIEAHGGTIGFTSHEGKGSTFWFEVPG